MQPLPEHKNPLEELHLIIVRTSSTVARRTHAATLDNTTRNGIVRMGSAVADGVYDYVIRYTNGSWAEQSTTFKVQVDTQNQ